MLGTGCKRDDRGRQMKAAIIGASEEALHTIDKAHAYGLVVAALDGNPKAAGLKAADQAIVTDISDEKAAIEAVRKENPDFVLTAPIGRYLTTIGAVNDALGLPGISKEMAELCTDKLKFHRALNSKGLRNCHCYGVDAGQITDGAGRKFWKKDWKEEIGSGRLPIKFPVILKPRYGSGSRGIYLTEDPEQLSEALDVVSGEPYVLEECVPGEEFGVDGAVIQGEFQMLLLRRKENTPPPARQAVGYFSVLPSDGFWQQAYDYMKQVTKCLGLKECLLHADMIKSPEGPFVIELSARPSGHNLHNLFTPLCTGVDMVEEYIKYRMGLPCHFAPENTKPMLIHYFDMQGKVKHVPDLEQVQASCGAKVVAWKCNLREGEELLPVSDGHSVMGRGYFVLEGDDPEFLKDQAEKIKIIIS